MTKSDKTLVWVMRIMGGSMMLAIIAVVMPDKWLKLAVHEVDANVPVGPLIEYVARGWSAFYFMLGGLIWLFSTDLARYLPAIRWVSWCYALLNGAFLAVLGWLYATMENDWTWFFGVIAFDVAVAFLFGLALLLLSKGVQKDIAPEA
ncbi:MAG: hypothetical protein CMI30_12565 [Opitutae bacterium]|nr:hypothetical protein [Opitutae bacterium]